MNGGGEPVTENAGVRVTETYEPAGVERAMSGQVTMMREAEGKAKLTI